jgi:hypothetical protein
MGVALVSACILTYMNFNLLSSLRVGYIIFAFSLDLMGQENIIQTAKSTPVEGVEFEVQYSSAYPTTGDIWLSYIISNRSNSNIAAIRSAQQTYDLDVTMYDPDGLLMKPIAELPGYIPRGGSQMTVKFGDGERAFRGQLKISDYFEIRKIGRYRCQITKKCYLVDTKEEGGIQSMKLIQPVELSSPEFVFEVEAINQSYSESIDKASKMREHVNSLSLQLTQREEPQKNPGPDFENGLDNINKDTHRSQETRQMERPSIEPVTKWILGGGIVIGIGLLLLWLNKKKGMS